MLFRLRYIYIEPIQGTVIPNILCSSATPTLDTFLKAFPRETLNKPFALVLEEY